MEQIVVDNLMTELNTYSRLVYNDRLTDRVWTGEIKRIVGELGLKNGCQVCTSGFPGYFHNEWLYDITWYKENDQGNLTEIILAAESEWRRNYSAIKFDFQKLIQAKAELRLMVFQGYEQDIETDIKLMIDEIENFKDSVSGDRYLFAGLNWNIGEFVFVAYSKK